MSFNIFIDSRNKQYGSNSDFTVLFSDFNLQNQNVLVSLSSISFYNLQYPINANNKSIVFAEAGDSGTLYTATLTEGQYTGTELATEIATQLNASTGNAYTYNASYDSATGKLTIDCTALPDTFSFSSISLDTFGFEADVTTFAETRTGTSPINVGGVPYIDLLMPSLINSNITDGNNSNGIFHRIPLSVGWGSLVSFQSSLDHESIQVNKEYLDNIRVRIKNPDGTNFILPDNGYVSIVLRCKIVN